MYLSSDSQLKSMRWIVLAVMILLLPVATAAHGGKPEIIYEKSFESIPKSGIKNGIREQGIVERKDIGHRPPITKNETKNQMRHQPPIPIREEDRVRIMEEIKNKIIIQKENREISKEKRGTFEKSLQQRFEDYHNYRKLYQKMGLQSEEGFQYAKRYVFHGAYAIIDFLKLIKTDLETLNIDETTKQKINKTIDEIIQTLEAKIEKINQSYTIEEFRDAVGDLSSYWKSVRNDVKIYAELIVVAKLDDLIKRAEIIGLNLNSEVDLSEYFKHLDNAKIFLTNATEKISNGMDAREDIQIAREEIRRAFEILREIYKETQPFFGNETGQLWVEINGTAMVSGSAIIHIKGNATVEVSPLDAVVTAVGFKKSDGVLTGDGNLVIKGNVNVNATGDFCMFVKGVADVYLEGKGEYKVRPVFEEEFGEFQLSGNETIVLGGKRL